MILTTSLRGLLFNIPQHNRNIKRGVQVYLLSDMMNTL
jgi:hypothetical protein